MDLRFFEIYRSAEYLELLALGLFNSALLTTLAGMIGFSVGVFLAVIRYERVIVLGFLCASYTDFVRNTPLVVQMFFVTFGCVRGLLEAMDSMRYRDRKTVIRLSRHAPKRYTHTVGPRSAREAARPAN